MSGRNVLICGLDYWPDVTGIAPYTTGFAEHLAAQGDHIEVMAGMPYYPEWKVRSGYERKWRHTEQRNGVTILRHRQYIPSRQSALHRAAYEASFMGLGMFSKRLTKPDLVVGVMPALSDGVLAARIAKRRHVPLTLWIQDLFGQAALQSGVSGGHRVAEATARLEGWIARQADSIAIVAEGFRPVLEGMGVAPECIHRVHNWTHIGRPTMGVAETRAALGLPHDKTVCMHAGNMGLKQGLENIIDCARLAQHTAPDLTFVLMGDGNQRSHLQHLAQDLPNVRFLDPVSNDMFPNALHAADILLINQRGTVTDMSLPSKLTSYLAVDRPIVAAVAQKSEITNALEGDCRATVVGPGDPVELAKAIATSRRLNSNRCSGRDSTLESDGAPGRLEALGALKRAILAADARHNSKHRA